MIDLPARCRRSARSPAASRDHTWSPAAEDEPYPGRCGPVQLRDRCEKRMKAPEDAAAPHQLPAEMVAAEIVSEIEMTHSHFTVSPRRV